MSNVEHTPTTPSAPRAMSAADWLAAPVLQLSASAVQTPELGDGSHCHIAMLSADERDELESLWAEKKESEGSEDNVGFRAWVVAFCLCDAERNRFYTAMPELELAAKRIGQNRPAKVIARIFNQACRINGLLKSDVDELEKKSEQTPSGSGNGESRLASDSQAAPRGSGKSRRSSTPSS